jgi:ribosomal protein S18 acetylase RimI-like enzyme
MATIRNATSNDCLFLQDVLAIAFNWRDEVGGLTVEEVMARPDISHYISGWPRSGDFGVVAEDDRPIGAAWWRYLTEDDPGYGFVDSNTPEITIGIAPEHRGKGVGRTLLDALIERAEELHLSGLSLSVEPENRAIRLYEVMGFEVVGRVGGALTMLWRTPAP